MNRIEIYFSLMPWWAWLISIFLGFISLIAFFGFTPKNLRLAVAIAVMIVWIELGRWLALGPIQMFAKTTYMVPVILVGCVAVLSNAPKRRIHPLALLIPIAGLVALAWIAPRATSIELILHVMQIVNCFAAIMVARCCWADEQTRRILIGICIGFSITLSIPIFELITKPGMAFIAGLNRFAPLRSNPNQIGPIFVISTALGAYLFLAYKNTAMRTWGVALLTASLALGLLTGSRGVVYTQVVILIPALVQAIKKPILAITGFIVIAALASFLVAQSAQTIQQGRLTSLETARYELQLNYLQIIMKNPVFGYGRMTVQSSDTDWGYSSHAHSAYLTSAYFAGLPYMLIVLLPSMLAILAGYRLWRFRLNYQELSKRYLFAWMLLIALMMQGLVTSLLYYPTFSLSFIHIWVVSWLLASWRSAKMNEPVELYYANHS